MIEGVGDGSSPTSNTILDGDVTITGNNAVHGGGIFNQGTVTFAAASDVAITDNNADFGGGSAANFA